MSSLGIPAFLPEEGLVKLAEELPKMNEALKAAYTETEEEETGRG